MSLQKSLPALEAYSKCRSQVKRNEIISRFTPRDIEHLARCVRTGIHYGGNIFPPKVKTKLKKRLLLHQKELYGICRPGVSCHRRRELLKQSGGSIPLLLASLIPMAVDLFKGIFSKQQ